MKRYPRVILKKGKEASLKRFHPWVFSGAIERTIGSCVPGDIVEIYSISHDYLGSGHFQDGSIAVKLFTFQQLEINYSFWKEKITRAYLLRSNLGLTSSSSTNAYRLVFTEGDELPGLIVDWYNGVAVIQTHSLGMHLIKHDLVNILKEIYGDALRAVYDKSAETTLLSVSPLKGEGDMISSRVEDGYIFGVPQKGLIKENGHIFSVDWEKGQKTGFFLDQRSNRMFAQFYAKDKKVLNAFSYSGAFSVYVLQGGAALVHSADSSKQAIEWTKENLVLNGIDSTRYESLVTDVKQFLVRTTETYDMIILDPPAFAKHHNITNNALQAYIHINSEAIKKINPGGILMTFSCSQAISREMFRSAIQSAALESGRKIRILHHLSQGPDHPISIYHPEGEYLKGLILQID